MTTNGTSSSTKTTLLKNALFITLVAATAFVGVKLGMGSRGSEGEEYSQGMPESKLKPGVVFPDIPVQNEEGTFVSSQSLIAGKGGVVLFMDLSCPPCQEMSKKVQAAFASDLSDVTIVGITPDKPHDILYYKKEHGITFPMYSDTAFAFMTQQHVQNFPLLVIVGKSGQVRDFTYDARLEIDPDNIHALIEQ